MSIHVEISEEAKRHLRSERKKSTVTSILISLLVLCLLGIIMWWKLLPQTNDYIPEIVSYQASSQDDTYSETTKINRNVKRKPTTPVTTAAQVIASNSASDISLPVTTEAAEMETLDFSAAETFEDPAWETEDWNKEEDQTKSTSFFGETITSEYILYIIDFSASMKGTREKLMREELENSIRRLPIGQKYQLIFFAGPSWIAGEQLVLEPLKRDKKNKSGLKAELKATFTNKEGKKHEWKGKKTSDWEPEGRLPKAQWISATSKMKNESAQIIKSNELVGGSNWSYPFEIAFSMSPLPSTVIFMTDGATGKKGLAAAMEYSKQARRRGIVINAVALMEPKAVQAMSILAEKTDGKFSLIDKEGKKVSLEEYEKSK